MFQNLFYLCLQMARLVEFDEEQAIRKAMEVFWKKGYTATSMRDLTDAMQINSSSLYNTLGDKHRLFIRCIKQYTEMRIKTAEQRKADFDSPFKALASFINDAVEIITTENNTCLCIKASIEIDGDSEVQNIINGYDRFTHQFLKNLIESAQNENEIGKKESADTLADYLTSLFVGWYNSYAIHQDRNKVQAMADYVIHHLNR